MDIFKRIMAKVGGFGVLVACLGGKRLRDVGCPLGRGWLDGGWLRDIGRCFAGWRLWGVGCLLGRGWMDDWMVGWMDEWMDG